MWPDQSDGVSPVNVILYSLSFYVPHVKIKMADFKAQHIKQKSDWDIEKNIYIAIDLLAPVRWMRKVAAQ